MDKEPKSLMEMAAKGLGVPQGTSIWPWPKKPLGKAPGAKGPAGKSAVKGQKSPSHPKGPKPSRGLKQRKSGAGTIFAGWD